MKTHPQKQALSPNESGEEWWVVSPQHKTMLHKGMKQRMLVGARTFRYFPII